MEEIPVTTVVAGAAFLAGLVFGATAQRTNFCTLGAISDAVLMGDYRRFRAWMLAIAVALLGSQALHGAGVVSLYDSIYLRPNLDWLGAVAGGLMFGFGMTMAGGCGYRTVVRLGGGNLKSLVVLMTLGIVAYMTLGGLIATFRVTVVEATNINLREAAALESQGIVDIVAALVGAEAESIRRLVVGVTAAGLLWFCFRDPGFRASGRNLAAGLIVGALVPVGWWITGVLGADPFEPVPLFSFTFVSPIAGTLQYLMTFTGATLSFGVGAVAGVIVGAFMAALAFKEFRVEAFADAGDLKRHLVGGALMGSGGILALGCTIGQGITGLSTLALGSLVAWLSILAGSVYGIRYLDEGSLGGAFKAMFARG